MQPVVMVTVDTDRERLRVQKFGAGGQGRQGAGGHGRQGAAKGSNIVSGSISRTKSLMHMK